MSCVTISPDGVTVAISDWQDKRIILWNLYTGKEIGSQRIEAQDKDKVLVTVGKLAAPIRKALGDATPESDQLAAAETYTSASLEAAHAYAQAQELQYAGKSEEAARGYLKAVELDANLGRAYSGLATLSRNMGRPEDAEKYFKEALARIDRMSDRERYRTRGVYYMTIGNFQKAVEEYTALVKQYPADTAGHANLAVSHGFLRNMGPAVEEARLAVEINPKSLPQRYNLAEFLVYTGDFAAAGREARIVIGSWYGDKRAPVDLGGHFHRGRLRIVSSQVSHIAPALSARWDRARRFRAALRALGGVDVGALVTHRIPLAEAQQAYELLDRHPDRAVQVLLLPG